jgi:hypothetical protein
MAVRTLGVPCPGGIDAAIAWILGKTRINTGETDERENLEPTSKLLRFMKPNRATCSCGCHDFTGEASRCPNCEEPLFR